MQGIGGLWCRLPVQLLGLQLQQEPHAIATDISAAAPAGASKCSWGRISTQSVRLNQHKQPWPEESGSGGKTRFRFRWRIGGGERLPVL